MATGRRALDLALQAIRRASGNPLADWATTPRRLEGGSWADIYRVALTNAPTMAGDLVLRILPTPESWEREMLVQGHVAQQGFPAPHVHLGSRPTTEFDRAWILMDFDPGDRLFSKLNKAALIRVMLDPRNSAPPLLARTMAAVHAVDASAIAHELAEPRTVAPGLNWFYSRAAALGDLALIQRAEHLLATRPPFRSAVLCHGDLHSLNILRGPERDTVVDWTHAQYDDPLYDVAFTNLGLWLLPIPVPAAFRPLTNAYGHRLSRQFLHEYERVSGTTVDRDRLAWFTRVVALRIFIEAEEDRRKGKHAKGFESAGMMFEPYLLQAGL